MRVFKLSTSILNNVRAYGFMWHSKTHILNIYRNSKLLGLFASPKFTCLQFNTLHKVNFVHNLSTKSGKLFQEIENEYAHFVMSNSGVYSRSLLKFPLEITDCLGFENSVEQLNSFNEFAKVTVESHGSSSIENEKFSSLVKDVCSSLPQASDDEIQRVLHCLCMWPPTAKTFTPNFKSIWNALDQECVKRLKNWDVSHKLLIADYWFCLRLSRISRFNRKLIFNMVKNCEFLTSQQLVQLMFYVNLQRQFPDICLQKLEKKLELVVDSITVEELGIICLAYFKTKNKISSASVIESVIKQLISNLETVNTVTVAAILKFLRKSLNLSLIDTYISALHKCISYVNKWDIPTSVHLALLSSECNVYHPLLLDNVSNKLASEISQSRIKDCVKLLQCLVHFNHYKKNFHNLIFAEVKKSARQKEVNSYPKDIVYLALYSAYVGHFDYEVLSKIFSKHFFDWCIASYPDVLPAFAEIDYCVEIECQPYSGPKLELMHRKILETRRGNIPTKISHQNMQTRLTASIYECLIEILGSDENVLIRHILPHAYSPDIIVKMQGKSKTSLREMCEDFPADVVLVPSKNEVWACIVVCGIFSFAYRSKQMNGVTTMKIRQLQKLGYRVIFIPFYDVPQNSLLRQNFLKEQMTNLEEKHLNNIL